MSNPTHIGYEEKLETLRLGYIGRLQREAAELKELEEWYLNASLSREDLNRIHRLAHGLSGTGSLFGFPEVSKAAAPLDQMLTDLLSQYDQLLSIPLEKLRSMGQLLSTLQGLCQQESYAYVAPETVDEEPKVVETGSYILLVDDDADLAVLLAARLQSRGIHVITTTNGAEAWEIIDHQAPDLVILDVRMPGLSGHDVLKRLKYDRRFSLIPVVMLSAERDQADEETAKRLGAIDYILKPCKPDELVQRLETLLDAARFHVVITDNDDMLLELLREKFQQRGFRVSTQNDGKDAWDFIFRTLPDLVILDRMMPGMDGMAVLKNIRTEPETKNIPVIVLSARKEERDIQIGMQFGAQNYVTKPCDPEDLLNRALELLQRTGSGKIHSQH